MDKIYFSGPSVTREDEAVVLDAMRNGWYEHAYDYCELFQKEFAEYHDRRFGLMAPNCTSAIHLFLKALGIGPEDEVIIPDCTWIATGAGITYQGAETIFCDVDPLTWCIDVQAVEKCITEKTKAVIAVDLYGNMPDMDALADLAAKHNITLLEDAAEALGSTYKGRKAGSFGAGSVFSFHRTKTLTTGEGGMLLIDDEELYERCLVLRDHGRRAGGKMYYNYEVTPKYMPFNLQAALGYAQFLRIDELIAIKKHHLSLYRERLSDMPDVQLNSDAEGGENTAWITNIVFGESYNFTNTALIEKLVPLGVPVRTVFYPLSSLPAYPGAREIYEPRNPVAYKIYKKGINLPGAAIMTDEQLDYVCRSLKQVVKELS